MRRVSVRSSLRRMPPAAARVGSSKATEAKGLKVSSPGGWIARAREAMHKWRADFLKLGFISQVSEQLKNPRAALLFVPGLLLVTMSIAAITMPRLLLPLAALFLFFAGLALTLGAWKLLQLKAKLQALLKNVEGRLIIQGVAPQELFEEQKGSEGNKKIVLH